MQKLFYFCDAYKIELKIENKFVMTSTTESTRTYWLYTVLSLAAIAAFLVVSPEWFWVALPFFATYFVKAMRWM